MANSLIKSIGQLSDTKLIAVAGAVRDWLKIPGNLAKTGMPLEIRDELIALTDKFWDEVATQNSAKRSVSTTLRKNDTRKKLRQWFSDNFFRFIADNTGIDDEDRRAMGWHARPVRRKKVPPPTKLICLVTAYAKRNGNIYATAAGENKGIGKPQDVDGVEFEYYTEDPRHHPDAKSATLGQYTNVKQEIEILFPPQEDDIRIYIRGRWYNKSGKSEWSPLVSVLIPRD